MYFIFDNLDNKWINKDLATIIWLLVFVVEYYEVIHQFKSNVGFKIFKNRRSMTCVNFGILSILRWLEQSHGLST